MYQMEAAFLAKVESALDRSNRRNRLDLGAIDRIRQTFPGIPDDYLAYLQEIGPGSVRECQYMIYDAPFRCDEDPFSLVNTGGRNLLIIGDNFAGDLFVFDADHDYRMSEYIHETEEILPCSVGFKEFVRDRMQIGADGSDQRKRRV